MKESAERVQYITEYVVSYKAKIEALNKKGLFDTATLYELFSQKVCEIWFGHKFLNLNDSKANYPYVDLISEDGKMYVQVSTGQDIPTKVKSTLEKIRDSKSDELKSIEQLFFFVLANSSESKVMDFSGKERIGRINFIKSKNLITTENIVQKAKTDIEFQKKLYDFLLTESESVVQISNKLNEAITISKVLINNNIDCLINDEYIIDRSSEISQIRKDGFNFISIQGEAGSGKSALCKLLLEKEKMVLYTRAEKIAEVSSLEDIWGLDIGKTIEYLKKKKLYIYIDELEFIVDCSKTKMDLLQQIYEIVKGHNNIFIITSCRTCDRTAFVKIENIYQIKRYDIFLLSDKQIIKVAQKYKIVQKLWDAKGYVQLLRSPFYLNLLVKEIKDFKKISDIDGFRNLIWNDIMCMSGKTFPQGITHSAVREAIEKIVFNRAEKFLPGVRKEEIGEEIVNILQSENIITTYVGVSKEDMLLYNWRITGRWINPLWKNTGIDPLKERDGEFSWENQSGTSIISEYNEENVYKPDDELYVYYHQIFEDSMPYIREMFSLYANDEKEKLYTWISENKEQIQEFYNKTTNGCCSRIREWNEFIKHYSLLYIELNNICLVIENRNWNPQAKWHLVGRKIHSIQKEKDVIEKGEVKWRKTLDVTDEELKKYKPCYENHQVRSFTQTIPVSEDAIEVRMEIKYEKNTEGKIIVSGKTNLFDGAQLLISITPDGKFYGPSCKVNCLNGTFTSVPLGNGTNLSGKCRLSITMPVSSVQPIEFVKKAGMQYENLKGDFIVRDGISPSGKYEQEVIL